MKKSLIVAGAVSLALAPTMALANEPVELNSAQMDLITAGDLILPNQKEMFDNFDNPSPQQSDSGFPVCGSGLFDGVGGDGETGCHPALSNRNPQSIDSTAKHDGAPNDGPWQAAVHSPVITCVSDLDIAPVPCPAGSF